MTANHGEPDTASATAPTRQVGRVPADTFSNRLMLARALAGHVSIREACEMTGLNRGNWQGWERGLRPRDILDVCRRISDALDIDHDWLLFGGSLAGPHGIPTKRAGGDTLRYPAWAARPTDNRPNGRSQNAASQAPNPRTRRAVLVGDPIAA